VRTALGPGFEGIEWTAVSGEECLVELSRAAAEGTAAAKGKPRTRAPAKEVKAGDAALGAKKAGAKAKPAAAGGLSVFLTSSTPSAAGTVAAADGTATEGTCPASANAGVCEAAAAVDVPALVSQWTRVSTTQKVIRFRPPAVDAALAERDTARTAVYFAAASEYASLVTGLAAQLGAAARALLRGVAEIDAFAALGHLAASEGYCKPVLVAPLPLPPLPPTAAAAAAPGAGNGRAQAGGRVWLRRLRHPLVEALMRSEGKGPYIPNDCVLGWTLPPEPHSPSSDVSVGAGYGAAESDGTLPDAVAPVTPAHARALLITGPNMGGKSSYVRSVALTVLMAHVGSFVPAASAHLSVLPGGIYTRMGASDAIMSGKSTFFAELLETGRILARAGPRTLVLLDELGRGTSSHDGAALAYAVLRYLRDRARSLTLFITHYPVLGEVAAERPAGLVTNAHVAFFEPPTLHVTAPATHGRATGKRGARAGGLTFLYRLRPGLCPRSFGLHVARLAGVPAPVLAGAAAAAARAQGWERSTARARGVAATVGAAAALRALCARIAAGESEDEARASLTVARAECERALMALKRARNGAAE
jgi:DNA mismatch repair protein MSH3